jgi:hypothetical protein
LLMSLVSDFSRGPVSPESPAAGSRGRCSSMSPGSGGRWKALGSAFAGKMLPQ